MIFSASPCPPFLFNVCCGWQWTDTKGTVLGLVNAFSMSSSNCPTWSTWVCRLSILNAQAQTPAYFGSLTLTCLALCPQLDAYTLCLPPFCSTPALTPLSISFLEKWFREAKKPSWAFLNAGSTGAQHDSLSFLNQTKYFYSKHKIFLIFCKHSPGLIKLAVTLLESK